MFAKNIVDIVLKNSTISMEKNLLPTSESVEAQVSGFNYSGRNLMVNSAAENAKFPPFIQAFYQFVFAKNRLPDEREIIHFYFAQNNFNDENFVILNGASIPKDAVIARLLRTFPSIIRDFHFYLLMQESGLFSNLAYSLREDYKNGVDLTFCHSGRKFCLSIYLETARGSSFKNKKNSRHDYSKMTEICLPVRFGAMKKCGEIYLLTHFHLKEILEKIEKLPQ